MEEARGINEEMFTSGQDMRELLATGCESYWHGQATFKVEPFNSHP